MSVGIDTLHILLHCVTMVYADSLIEQAAGAGTFLQQQQVLRFTAQHVWSSTVGQLGSMLRCS